MNLEEKTLNQTYKFNGKIINLRVDDVELPDGNSAYREVVEHPGGVCIAALTADGALPFVRQFRYPYKEIVTELPAGKLEYGEDPFEAAQRELSEEVGAVGSNWRCMGKLYPTPGYCGEIIHLYTCDISEVAQSHPDSDEFLETLFIPLDQAVELVMQNKIPDAKTQTLILKLWTEKNQKQ